MKKLLKLPLRIAALPLIAVLLVFQLISSAIVGLTSIATNLLATVFLIGSVAGWIANAPNAPNDLIFQTIVIGIFFAVAPHFAGWMLEKVTDLTLGFLDFLLS
ncbi:MAG: hypothetical protein IJ438_12885 [Clostridia bacterium]|nr:hypothetical protein [Clostridia bacterium]